MTGLRSSERPLSGAFDILLTDLDGVCYRGSAPVPHAASGMAEAKRRGARAVYITNNSSRPPQVVADHLTSLDIPTDADDVFNSARTGVMQLLKHVPEGSKVLALGGEGVHHALAQANLTVVDSADDEPVAVIQGLSHAIGWAELSEAVLAIKAGAIHVATNLDATLPKERGEMIGNGSLVAAVVYATGVEPLSSGKPAPDMYQLAVEETGAKNPLAVGDRLNTDIIGANRAGFPSLHVLTGVSLARDIMLAEPEERPTFLGLDLSDLNLPMPPVEKVDAQWICREATAQMEDNELLINGSTATSVLALDEYRAAVAAVWEARDQGRTIDDLAWLPQFEVHR